jgi:hypothetical protein
MPNAFFRGGGLTFGGVGHNFLLHKQQHAPIDNKTQASMPETDSFIRLSGHDFLLISGSAD